MKKGLLVLTVALLMSALAAPAYAIVYKNPAHDFGQGKYAAGVSYISSNRDFTSEGLGDSDADIKRLTLNLSIGVGQSGLIGLHVGSIDVSIDGQGETGEEYGVSYRHRLTGVGNPDVPMGFLVSYRYGYIDVGDVPGLGSGVDMEVERTDLAFGAAKTLQDNMSLYFGGVYSAEVATVNAYYTYEADAADEIGGFAGIEFAPSPDLLAGVEAHLINESAFGFYLDFRF